MKFTNFLRSPLTEPREVKRLKSVTLYQIPVDGSVNVGRAMMDSLMGRYMPLEQMVPVFNETANAELSDEFILDNLFEKMNNIGDADIDVLYSMNAGDAVTIDDAKYRCTAFGWERF